MATAVILKGEKLLVTELIEILRTGLFEGQTFPFIKEFLCTFEF